MIFLMMIMMMMMMMMMVMMMVMMMMMTLVHIEHTHTYRHRAFPAGTVRANVHLDTWALNRTWALLVLEVTCFEKKRGVVFWTSSVALKV